MQEHSESSPTPERPAKKSAGRASPARTSAGLQRRFVDTLGWVILAVWVASMATDAIVKGYDPPAVVHGLMTIVATAAFGSGLISRRKDDDDE